MDNRRRRGVPKNLFDLHARYYQEGTGDESVDAAFGDAFGESTSEDVGGFGNEQDDDAEHGAAVTAAEAEAAMDAGLESGAYGYGNLGAVTGMTEEEAAGFIGHLEPGYTFDKETSAFLSKALGRDINYSYENMYSKADEEDEQSGLTSIGGDTPQDYLLGEETETEEVIDDGSSSLLGGRSRRTFLPSGFWSTRPGSGLDAKRMSQEDQLLYAASPDERYQYLLSRSSEGIMPPKGYNTPSGQYIDLTLVYPDVYAPKMAEGGMIEESSMVEYDPVQIEERANMILEEAYD